MQDKLKDLRSKMNKTVLKDGELSERNKDQLYYNVISSNKLNKKKKRFVPVLSLVSSLVVIFILVSYGFSNYITSGQIGRENVSEEMKSNTESEENEESLFDKNGDRIGEVLEENVPQDENPEKIDSIPTESQCYE